MLSKNIKNCRKSKGLSQDELAVKLNVVRQTVSKWERGLSVPDSEMLINLSNVFEIPVSTLVGETIEESKSDDLKVISEKLEVINLQLAKREKTRRRVWHYVFGAAAAVMIIIMVLIVVVGSPYLGWDYTNPELAVTGVLCQSISVDNDWINYRLYYDRKKGLIFL